MQGIIQGSTMGLLMGIVGVWTIAHTFRLRVTAVDQSRPLYFELPQPPNLPYSHGGICSDL